MPMLPSARRYYCPHCQRRILICRHCDRGNTYCPGKCAKIARKKSLLRAAARYRLTRRGRHNNAARPGRFRARQKRKSNASGFTTRPRSCSTPARTEYTGKPCGTRARLHPQSHFLPYLSPPMRSVPQKPLPSTIRAPTTTPGHVKHHRWCAIAGDNQ